MNPPTIAVLSVKNEVVFKATCPNCFKFSSVVRGYQRSLLDEDVELWAFRCKCKGGSIFLAEAPAQNPRTPEQLAALKQKLMVDKAMKVTKSQS